MKHYNIAAKSIENFSLNEKEYSLLDINHGFTIYGEERNVFVKDNNGKAQVTINFGNSINCKVFIGENLEGELNVTFHGNNSILYIGSGCKLRKVQIRSFQNNDFIAVGNYVTTTAQNIWISGNGAGNANPAIIIGDDCMFSYDIVIRNSDAHPIFSSTTDLQVNEPSGIVHIEPHVWICEKVNILKTTTIGACSIVALGSIVTKDVPRFSIAKGTPAKSYDNKENYWARGNDLQSREKAKHYLSKYMSLQEGVSPDGNFAVRHVRQLIVSLLHIFLRRLQ